MRAGLLQRMDQSGVPLALARVVLGLVFIGSGWSKAGAPEEFLKLLREYAILPDGWYVAQNLLAVTLPWIEIVCGVTLILGLLVRGSSMALLVMLTGFTAVIVIRALGIHHSAGTPLCDIHFDCGCGGGDVYMCRKLPENVGLWLLTWIGLLSGSRRFCLSGVYSVAPPEAASGVRSPSV